MSSAKKDSGAEELLPGYVAIPVSDGQAEAPLRLCVLVRRESDPVGGHLVVLRDMVDGQVFLGCILDRGGRLHRWVELWIQNVDGLAERAEAWQQAVSNASLDERWRRHFHFLESADGDDLTRTGWETEHPRPAFLDLETLSPVHPTDADGRPWELCTDDDVLGAKGLPPYGASLHRYLFVRESGAESLLAAVTSGAPAADGTVGAGEIAGAGGLIPFNPGGGLMLVRRHSPVGFEEYVDILGGASWKGRLHGRTPLVLGAEQEALKEAESGGLPEGRLFLDVHGRWGRFVETFHLKLRVLADAFRAVRAIVRSQQRPLLNLSAESFSIELAPPGSALPFMWTARAVLVDPGNAIAVPVKGSDSEFFVSADDGGMSIYRPASAGLSVRGAGTVRIRQVLSESGGMTEIEGTFSTQERIAASPRDLVWMRLRLRSGRLDVYAHLEDTKAMARGEFRFRTIAQKLDGKIVEDLKAAEGVPIPHTPFDILPSLGSPCDLYALAVLAVRTLLVDAANTLPIALDEFLSLAREVAAEYEEGELLSSRIKRIFEGDKRWSDSLGPQRLAREDVTPEQAFDLIPESLWWDTLGVAVCMLPGTGPDSRCRDYGDAPKGGIHRVFDEAIAGIDDLLLRTRSLVVIDWRSNREIGSVISGYLANLPEGGGAGKGEDVFEG